MNRTPPKEASASPRCHHVKDDGTRCGSPALRGRHFCYTHHRVHNGLQIATRHSCRAIPPLNSGHNIRLAVTNLLRDLRDGSISLDEARLMAYGLQIANATLTRKQRADLGELHYHLSRPDLA